MDVKNTTYLTTIDDTTQDVIVSFIVRYNETAHRLPVLAGVQLAPKLRVVGDLYMIVIDRVVWIGIHLAALRGKNPNSCDRSIQS